MIKKPGKPTRTKMKKEADKLFSLIVRSRGECQAKGLDIVHCSGNHQCCHIYSRRYLGMRWDERNALNMCQAHHTYYTMNPEKWFVDFIPVHFPDQWKFVQANRNAIIKPNMASVIQELSEKKRLLHIA